ncbi:PAS-domain containing protein [Roseomonas sp. SSH11]|uniref:histidine kinase n=1 Tax=Pararoseomonas baculiformis TaxID=2820812 RepID=A0ABS4A8W3_9PROT|nr:PAS domain-containing sensor histidine kinase [Pararoseomonas baculiformis]MBP0443443.1 PAS-domain containing protein [Pararoseomonas baculiformis]
MTDPSDTDALLHAALGALPMGIAVYDREARLVYANAALWKQAGRDAAPLPPGTSRAEVIALLARAGHYGVAKRDTGALAASLCGDLPQRHLTRNTAGRWHEMGSVPLPDGGWVGYSMDVTGSWRTEADVIPHAALLETILERLDTGVLVSDREKRVAYFNRAYRELTGAREDVLRPGMPRSELFGHLEEVGELAGMPPETRAMLPQLGERETALFSYHGSNGTIVSVRARPMAEGGVLTELHDVTALRDAERASQDRAELLDGVLAALPHGVCVYGPDRRVRLVNAAYQEIMADSPVEVGEHHRDIVMRRIAQGEYGEPAADTLARLQQDFDDARPYERTRTRPNGRVVSVRVVPPAGGGLVVVITDVTARAQAEAEAQRRATTLQAMLDNQPHGVALFDSQGYLIASNGLAGRLTGLGDAMRPGRHLLELRAEQIDAQEFGSVGDIESFVAARGDEPLHRGGLYARQRPDGSVLEVRTDRTPDGGFIRTYRDVTEERRIRSELEAARDAAEAASRAKSSFLATMTHELRTPLHAVIGFSEAILEANKPEVIRDHAQEVIAAGRQLLALVEGLLEATRIEADALSLRGNLFDPAQSLRNAGARARKLAKEAQIHFTVTVPETLPRVRADEQRLRQVLDALLSNAMKFTPEGGEVTLTVHMPDGAGRPAVVEIADTGIGMAPEDIPRAFEAFTQLEGGLSRRYPGSGLGLYLARALAGAMGMELTLDSMPGKGTTARLVLPPAEEMTA